MTDMVDRWIGAYGSYIVCFAVNFTKALGRESLIM